MPARDPLEVDRLFADALNRGDLDALVALYEPQAALTPEPGKTVVGHAAIRAALGQFVAGKPRIDIVPRVIAQSGDLALVSARWSVSDLSRRLSWSQPIWRPVGWTSTRYRTL